MDQHKPCLVCNKQFKFYRYSNKFCSKSCRNQENNRKQSLYKREWNLKNNDKIKASQQKWITNNPEKRKMASETYRKKNKEYYTEYASLRSRYLKQAKVKSLTEWDEFYIREFYALAALRELEVDHIIPLKHPLVSGLHVPENLQMLTRSENAKKSNKFDEDVICKFA